MSLLRMTLLVELINSKQIIKLDSVDQININI